MQGHDYKQYLCSKVVGLMYFTAQLNILLMQGIASSKEVLPHTIEFTWPT